MASWPAIMPRSASISPNPSMTLSIMSQKVNEKHCAAMEDVDYTNFVVSLTIMIGILLSYIPQLYRIISRRSSEGISPYFVLLGTLSANSAFANILALPTSREDWACCHVNSAFSCFAGLLGIGQLFIQWLCFFTILMLFLLYFPKVSAFTPPEDLKARPSYRKALIVTAIAVAHALILAVVTTVLGAFAPQYLQPYADFLGIFSACVTSIQYFPQIWTTWKMKRVGSLSIPMMCVQTPGGFLWSASLAARLGWEGWSAWGIYLITATMQGILLIMGVIFEIRHKRNAKKYSEQNEGDEVSETDQKAAGENTPLLGREGDA